MSMTRAEAIKHIRTWMYATSDLPPKQVAEALDLALALLGDHEAAKRVTARGELLPCPWCNRTPEVEYDVLEPFEWVVICPLCGVYPGCCDTEAQARLAWNTRAPILSAEEMEMLEGME